MMQRRRAEAVMRLGLGKSKPGRAKVAPPQSALSKLYTRLVRSKVISLGANFCGAISCILANEVVFQMGFDLPLTLTFFGYTLVSLSIVSCRDIRLGLCARPSSQSLGNYDLEKQQLSNGNGMRVLASGQARCRRLLLIFLTAISPVRM